MLVSNSIIEYIPHFWLNTQKLITFIFWNLKTKDFLEAQKNNSFVIIKLSKKQLFDLFWNSDQNKIRRDFLEAKKSLHDTIRINTEDNIYEFAPISVVNEFKRKDEIIFKLPFELIYLVAKPEEWNFFTPSLIDMWKLKSRYSFLLYQYFKSNKFKRKIEFYPEEFNKIMKTNMSPAHILGILLKTRDDFKNKEIDLDFSITPIKNWRRISHWEIIFINNYTLEEYSLQLKAESDKILKEINNYNWERKFIFTLTKLKKMEEYQINYIFECILKLDSENLKRKILEKILNIIPSKERKNKNFKIHCIAWVYNFTPSEINRKLTEVVNDFEKNKNKIKNKAALVIYKVNLLWEIQKKLKV